MTYQLFLFIMNNPNYNKDSILLLTLKCLEPSLVDLNTATLKGDEFDYLDYKCPKSGEISEERINESLYKILKTKMNILE